MGKKSKKLHIQKPSITLSDSQSKLSNSKYKLRRMLENVKQLKQKQKGKQQKIEKIQTKKSQILALPQIKMNSSMGQMSQQIKFRQTSIEILQFLANIQDYNQVYGQMVIDQNFTIIYADSFAKQLFQASLSPFQTNSLLDLIAFQDRQLFKANFHKCTQKSTWFRYMIYSKISARKYGNYPQPGIPLNLDYVYRFMKPLQSTIIPVIIDFTGYQKYKQSFWNKAYLGKGLVTKCYVLRTHQIVQTKQKILQYDFQNDQFIKKSQKNLRKKNNVNKIQLQKMPILMNYIQKILNQPKASIQQDSQKRLLKQILSQISEQSQDSYLQFDSAQQLEEKSFTQQKQPIMQLNQNQDLKLFNKKTRHIHKKRPITRYIKKNKYKMVKAQQQSKCLVKKIKKQKKECKDIKKKVKAEKIKNKRQSKSLKKDKQIKNNTNQQLMAPVSSKVINKQSYSTIPQKNGIKKQMSHQYSEQINSQNGQYQFNSWKNSMFSYNQLFSINEKSLKEQSQSPQEIEEQFNTQNNSMISRIKQVSNINTDKQAQDYEKYKADYEYVSQFLNI